MPGRSLARLVAVLSIAGTLSALPSSASADFRSSDPGEWARNRCVSRNVMSAALLTAPVGLGLLTADGRPGVFGFGVGLIAASGATLATGMALRILQPGRVSGLSTPYAGWRRDQCRFRSFATWGGPTIAFGVIVLMAAREAARNPFTRISGRIGTIAALAMMAGGVSMILYGSISARRQGEQPALDLGSPLVEIPVGGGGVSIGLGSLGYGAAF